MLSASVRLELRDGVDETVNLLVHAPARLNPESHCLLVLLAAENLVVHEHVFGVGDLERRAGAHVHSVHHRRVAGGLPDDVLVSDIAVDVPDVERALCHVERSDVCMLDKL